MTNPLGDLISRGEGSYNSYNRGTSKGRIVGANQTIDFSEMTISELRRRQGLPPTDPERVFAVGKYQMIPSTLGDAIDKLGLDGAAKFTPQLQERLFADYLVTIKRPEVRSYISARIGGNLHAAQQAICEEWASVDDPDTPGRPYGLYGKWGNRSTIRAYEVAKALTAMRSEFAAARSRGVSPEQAWRLVTGQAFSTEMERQGEHKLASRPGREAVDDRVVERADALRHGSTGGHVSQLQRQLTDLGYRDSFGDPLNPDGTFGHRTEQAVKAFQRAHGLQVDGVVGDGTRAALTLAREAPVLSDPTHPDHGLYQQALQGVGQLPASVFGNERERGNAAATVAFEAKVVGLQRIDHVVANVHGTGVFAVQGGLADPAHHRVYVDRGQAVRQSVEQMSEQLRVEVQAQTQPAHVQAQAHMQQQHVEQRGLTVGMRP